MAELEVLEEMVELPAVLVVQVVAAPEEVDQATCRAVAAGVVTGN